MICSPDRHEKDEVGTFQRLLFLLGAGGAEYEDRAEEEGHEDHYPSPPEDAEKFFERQSCIATVSRGEKNAVRGDVLKTELLLHFVTWHNNS